MAQQDQRPIKGYPDSIGPDIRSGGHQEPGGPVPPYEGRSMSGEDIHKRNYPDHEAGPREVSEVESQGVPSTDTTAASPLGVGVSKGRQGNERALNWSEEKREKERMNAGVAPTRPIDPASPNLPVGDQGG